MNKWVLGVIGAILLALPIAFLLASLDKVAVLNIPVTIIGGIVFIIGLVLMLKGAMIEGMQKQKEKATI